MAKDSGIGWTHSTWNPVEGCSKVSPACTNCYIHRSIRQQRLDAYSGKLHRTATWDDPYDWEEECCRTNTARMVFICSLSDFFHVGIDECRAQLWAIMRRTPHLIYRVLTKRPERIKAHLPPDWGNGYPNVWLGVTVEAKQWLHRMDTLRDVKAVLRWASVEPLLEDLSEEINLKGFGWIAVGGESGGRKGAKEHLWDPKADWKKGLLPIIGEDGKVNLDGSGLRTMKYEWAENLRKKVKATKGCLFMMKQVTAPRSGFGPNALDGVEWNELPAPPNGLQWLPFKPHKPSSTMTPEQIAGFKAGLTSPFKPPVEKRTKL